MYVFDGLHCGAARARTESVGTAEITAVERHLRAVHPDVLAPERHADFAEVLGHVRARLRGRSRRSPTWTRAQHLRCSSPVHNRHDVGSSPSQRTWAAHFLNSTSRLIGDTLARIGWKRRFIYSTG